MKKFFLLVLLPLVIAGCKSSTGPDNGSSGGARIAIKGTISAGSLSKRGHPRSVNSLSLSDARKVLVFNGSSYQLFDITDSAFTAYAQAGTATALAFLDANNKYIGNLCAGGLNVLPLVSLKDGANTVIDLSTLTLDSTSVIPANNPIGSTINMSPADVERFKELGGYYESLSKNIDADNDGVPDILDKKDINISTIYSVYVGRWGINDSLPLPIDTSRFFVNYTLRIQGDKAVIPASHDVTLSGPAEHPYTDIQLSYYTDTTDCFITFFQRETQAPPGYPFGSAFLPFEKGTYTLTLNGTENYTLSYSDVNSRYYMVIAEPTVHTDSQGRITSITVEYKLPDNSSANPADFVNTVAIQLTDAQANQLGQVGALWGDTGSHSASDIYNFTLDSPIDLSRLAQVDVSYTDLIGNVYNIIWK